MNKYDLIISSQFIEREIKMRVLKFGGTSLANARQFMRVADILKKNAQKEQIAAVLSAPSTITNYLILAINNTLNGYDIINSICTIKKFFNTLLKDIVQSQSQFNYVFFNEILEQEFHDLKKLLQGISLLKFCPDNINSKIISLGEKLSVILMQGILTARNFNIIVLNPVKMILTQGGCFTTTMVNIEESTRRIRNINISHADIVLMAGFIAGNKNGELVTLGRNGSDYSAAILSACLGASLCEIWTDVDGIYTCDPYQVSDVKLLSTLSYSEAMELSYFGAKILHPRTIFPIAKLNIPCLIKNIFKPCSPGTLISIDGSDNNLNIVKGVTSLKNIVMLSISGIGMNGMIDMISRVFSAISRSKCSVVLITQSTSEYSISFCISHDDFITVYDALNEEFYLEFKNGLLEPVNVTYNLGIISVVGDGIRTQLVEISNKLFGALDRANINIVAISQGSSERSISIVLEESVTTVGVKIVHQVLFNTSQVIEIFVIGAGGVGSALIEQIRKQYDYLKRSKHIDLRVCGIINSQVMLINSNGIDLDNWKKLLIQTQQSYNLNRLMSIIKEFHLLNPVIIDCTSSVEVANFYTNFLLGGCHVVTPNKKANTDSMEYYRSLRNTVITTRKKFLYDTNVGAGLPVIENLQNLLHSGDKLIKFYGILSGSLSYIFGKLDEGLLLSEATLLAKENGYTEPDPRDDLSGIDVARKLLILAREVGYELELEDICVEPVIPDNFINSFVSVNDFFKQLSLIDETFMLKVNQSKKMGHVLRYIGNIQQGKCCVKIESIDSTHPLFEIKNGENALVFFTKYYQPLPLVLRGYGAGNDVTASGVFADLLRTLF